MYDTSSSMYSLISYVTCWQSFFFDFLYQCGVEAFHRLSSSADIGIVRQNLAELSVSQITKSSTLFFIEMVSKHDQNELSNLAIFQSSLKVGALAGWSYIHIVSCGRYEIDFAIKCHLFYCI